MSLNQPTTEDFRQLPDLFKLVKELTQLEDVVQREGRPKQPAASLLFLAAQNVYDAKIVYPNEQEARFLYLPDRYRDEYKPCELTESVVALQEYLQNPSRQTALHALSEISDVFYNLAQAVQFPNALRGFEMVLQENQLFQFLLEMALVKFSYRYLKDGVMLSDVDFSSSNISESINLPARKDPAKEEEILGDKYEFLDLELILKGNLTILITSLHSVFSLTRSIASSLNAKYVIPQLLDHLPLVSLIEEN